MTIKLKSLAANAARERDGDWVEYPDIPGVAFKVAGIQSPGYVVAREAMMTRLAKRYKAEPVPPEVRAEAVGKLFAEHLLKDWRGFDVPYSAEAAAEVLADPNYRMVRDAVEWCAAQISQIKPEEVAA